MAYVDRSNFVCTKCRLVSILEEKAEKGAVFPMHIPLSEERKRQIPKLLQLGRSSIIDILTLKRERELISRPKTSIAR
ncbi:unnamed protein product [Caretta caretta]